ncbi:uncharacterized protein RHOBADRAFT_56419, partial [Rhodotorula graminis WP1]
STSSRSASAAPASPRLACGSALARSWLTQTTSRPSARRRRGRAERDLVDEAPSQFDLLNADDLLPLVRHLPRHRPSSRTIHRWTLDPLLAPCREPPRPELSRP